MGPAWADKAYAADTAHTAVECSNAGLCDRSTGMCACFDGYSGAACTRSLCPNECSGNGQCMTIGDMGQFEGKVRQWNATSGLLDNPTASAATPRPPPPLPPTYSQPP